jgi:hypothetical protein
MSKSPLSGAFADSSATTKKKNKKNGAILLISGVALATSIGGVFAANNSIGINNGSAIEFGQGVAATNTCDIGLTTSITQTFDNATGGFFVDDVVVGGIDTDACSQTTLRVGLVNDAGTYIDSYTVVRPTNAIETTNRADQSIDAGEVKKVTVTTENAG